MKRINRCLKRQIAPAFMAVWAGLFVPMVAQAAVVQPYAVLVLGGAGKIGSAVVKEFSNDGATVSVVGRRPISDLPIPVQKRFQKRNVNYLQLDLDAASSVQLTALFKKFQITADCAEDYPETDAAADAATLRSKKLFKAAIAAGYVNGAGPVYVRVGSPPAEIVRRLPHGAAAKYAEDFSGSLSLSQKTSALPYFRSKKATGDLARKYFLQQGFNIRTAAPTYVVGPGSWGEDREQLLLYYKAIQSRGISAERRLVSDWIDLWSRPFGLSTGQYLNGQWWAYAYDITVDTVTSDAAAQGIRLTALHGRAGEVYQLAGQPVSLASLLVSGLREAGVRVLPQIRELTQLEAQFGKNFESLTKAAWSAIGLKYSPLISAMPEAMGQSRSSQKAMTELGYRPPTQRDIDRANRKFVQFLKQDGQLDCYAMERVFEK